MTVRDLVTSGVKTMVQAAVAIGATYLLELGLDIDQEALANVLFPITAGLVAIGLNKLGDQFPIVNQVLSFGLSGQSATYNAE